MRGTPGEEAAALTHFDRYLRIVVVLVPLVGTAAIVAWTLADQGFPTEPAQRAGFGLAVPLTWALISIVIRWVASAVRSVVRLGT